MALLGGGGLLPVLLPDRTLEAGDMGDRDVEEWGARKGLLAASGLILGGAGLIGFGAGASDCPTVGALTLVTGSSFCVV